MSSFPKYSEARGKELCENLQSVLDEVKAAGGNDTARLVAISKLKPASDIMSLYDYGYRHFGENYIQELSEKAAELPKDIEWHFVGALQSNKAKLATAIPNLFVIESLSSEKLAGVLEKQLAALNPPRASPLNVYVQVNTSGEDSKSGVPPLAPGATSGETLDLVLYIVNECPHLRLLGFMTIGSWDMSHGGSERNEEMVRLVETRDVIIDQLKAKGVDKSKVGRPGEDWRFELSMGMSADFKQALKEGSDNVRVGTSIFGERPKKN